MPHRHVERVIEAIERPMRSWSTGDKIILFLGSAHIAAGAVAAIAPMETEIRKALYAELMDVLDQRAAQLTDERFVEIKDLVHKFPVFLAP